MPRRLRNVRMSVRQLNETLHPTQRVPLRSFGHLRFQKFTLYPLRPDEVFRLQRRGHDADWRAVGRANPEVKDGWRLVSFVDGKVERRFEVSKAMRVGRRQILLLHEVGEQVS